MPHTIKINHEGKDIELDLRIDVLCMRRLKRYPEPINILELVIPDNPDASLWSKMASDPSIAVDVCYEATRHDHRTKALSPEEFAEGLGGDDLERLNEAALGAIVDFTPSRENRALLKRVLEKSSAAVEKMRKATEEALESGVIDREIDHALEGLNTKRKPKRSSGVSGNSTDNLE